MSSALPPSDRKLCGLPHRRTKLQLLWLLSLISTYTVTTNLYNSIAGFVLCSDPTNQWCYAPMVILATPVQSIASATTTGGGVPAWSAGAYVIPYGVLPSTHYPCGLDLSRDLDPIQDPDATDPSTNRVEVIWGPSAYSRPASSEPQCQSAAAVSARFPQCEWVELLSMQGNKHYHSAVQPHVYRFSADEIDDRHGADCCFQSKNQKIHFAQSTPGIADWKEKCVYWSPNAPYFPRMQYTHTDGWAALQGTLPIILMCLVGAREIIKAFLWLFTARCCCGDGNRCCGCGCARMQLSHPRSAVKYLLNSPLVALLLPCGGPRMRDMIYAASQQPNHWVLLFNLIVEDVPQFLGPLWMLLVNGRTYTRLLPILSCVGSGVLIVITCGRIAYALIKRCCCSAEKRSVAAVDFESSPTMEMQVRPVMLHVQAGAATEAHAWSN